MCCLSLTEDVKPSDLTYNHVQCGENYALSKASKMNIQSLIKALAEDLIGRLLTLSRNQPADFGGQHSPSMGDSNVHMVNWLVS